ncbi:MAG: hypothetical protein ACOYL3_12060 [Desulfuromonadaceae bacterium]
MKMDIGTNVLSTLLVAAGMLFCCVSPVSAVSATVTLDGDGSGSVNSDPAGLNILCLYKPSSAPYQWQPPVYYWNIQEAFDTATAGATKKLHLDDLSLPAVEFMSNPWIP